LESIINQIDKRFEIIVTDNKSNDGSLNTLRNYAEAGKIILKVKKCSRGQGRQLAFENSSGEYIIANLDMDDIFKPNLIKLLMKYHAMCDGKLLLAVSDSSPDLIGFQNITIVPRSLVKRLGGWRNLQYSEDWDMWSRAAKIGQYQYLIFSIAESQNLVKKDKNFIQSLKGRYIRYREMHRLNRRIFFQGEQKSNSQILVSLISRIISSFHESYNDSFNRKFEPYDSRYLVNPEKKSK
jgi:glycosyltransferase involved in cell wall biosynthesis